MKITNCKLNHLTNPMGYTLDETIFSWMIEDTKAQTQTAARIMVKCHDEISFDAGWDDLTMVADTGWDNLDSLSTRMVLKLKPRTRYRWKVSVRAASGEEATRDENFFETSKMDEPWVAQWIGCNDNENRHPIFIKKIEPKKSVALARLYICGLGLYEASWEGKKIGDEYLTPYCNDYNSWVQYQTYDISDELQKSGTLSVVLGNGWYKGRFGFNPDPKPYYGDSWKLIAEVRILYDDGTSEVVGTDESWVVIRSNITFSNIYDGEIRDDTLDESSREPVVLTLAPKGVLTARYSTPIKARELLPVKKLIRTPAGELVLDIGQEITGGFRWKLTAPKGTRVRLLFGEILQAGNFYRNNLRTAKAEYVYISDGLFHVLEPKFTFYGYRFVKVEGLDEIEAKDFCATALYSEFPKAGDLTTGNTLINQLLSNVSYSQKDNFLDVPTDCPQRDERMGWTGDAQVFSPTACYLRDCYAFYFKYLHDIKHEQKDLDGEVPNVIPSFGYPGCSAAWGDAATIIPWNLYQFYGDPMILHNQYPSMKAWVDYIKRLDGDDHGWRKHFHFGDWLALDIWDSRNLTGGTDVGFVADVMYYHSTCIVAQTALVLKEVTDDKDYEADAQKYEALSGKLLDDIQKEYFTPTGRLAVPTQTGYLMSLEYELWPDKERLKAGLLEALQKNDGKLQTGFVGTPLLCKVLSDIGESDRAFDLLLSEDYPGWLYAVKLGATTIWERWNSLDPEGVIAENGMNSLNHYSYGSIAGWIYGYVAGLLPAEPGFKKAILRPHINAGLGEVKLSYLSATGRWHVHWKVLDNGDIDYHCTVPFGAKAKLYLPFGGGNYDLKSGDYNYVYTPDTPLLGRFSTNTPLNKLLSIRRVKAKLINQIPQISQLPPSMSDMSIRELSKRMGGRISDEALDQLDKMLFDI